MNKRIKKKRRRLAIIKAIRNIFPKSMYGYRATIGIDCSSGKNETFNFKL